MKGKLAVTALVLILLATASIASAHSDEAPTLEDLWETIKGMQADFIIVGKEIRNIKERHTDLTFISGNRFAGIDERLTDLEYRIARVETPRHEVSAGLSDMASVLAKWDQNPNKKVYLQRLLEIEECIWIFTQFDDAVMEFTNEELAALTLYMAGMFSMSGSMDLTDAVGTERWGHYQNLETPDGTGPGYKQLVWSIDICKADSIGVIKR